MQFLWLFLVAAVLASPLKVLTPTKDPWYDAPKDYKDKKHGDVLKIRKTPSVPRTVYFPMSVENLWQIMFRSEDLHGNASWGVTTLLEPFHANNSRLVLYQIAEDSSAYDCAPSYAMMYGANMNTISSQVEAFGISTLLERGYWVNIPDYEGQTAAFTAGRLAGHTFLDSIRLVLKTANETGISNHPEIVAWGYSGGLIPSGWGAAIQPQYAPELSKYFKGIAVGGFVTNVTETVVAVDGGLFAGLVASGVTGLLSEYPELVKVIKDEAGDRYDEFMDALNMCMVPSLWNFANENLILPSEDNNQTWVKDNLGLFEIPEVKDVLKKVTLGLNKKEIPEIPVWSYHGWWDDIVPHANSERIYDAWCDNGVSSFTLTTDMTGGHITDMFIGIPAAISWIDKRFAGEPVQKGCHKELVMSMLTYPDADEALVDFVKLSGTALFGGKLGPNAENATKEDLLSISQRGMLSDETLAKVKRGDFDHVPTFMKRGASNGFLEGL